MNELSPLTEADLMPYSQKKSVVRLFQEGKWYAGYVSHLTIFNGKLGVMIGSMIRFGHFEEELGTMNTLHHHLITETDMPIKNSRLELSDQFVLPRPMKLACHQRDSVLCIESANGTATISAHDEDISSVSMLFKHEEKSHTDD